MKFAEDCMFKPCVLLVMWLVFFHDHNEFMGVVIYCETSNIRHTTGNEIVDHSDVVGALPAGAAPTTSSFSTKKLASMDWTKTTARQDKKQ